MFRFFGLNQETDWVSEADQRELVDCLKLFTLAASWCCSVGYKHMDSCATPALDADWVWTLARSYFDEASVLRREAPSQWRPEGQPSRQGPETRIEQLRTCDRHARGRRYLHDTVGTYNYYMITALRLSVRKLYLTYTYSFLLFFALVSSFIAFH